MRLVAVVVVGMVVGVACGQEGGVQGEAATQRVAETAEVRQKDGRGTLQGDELSHHRGSPAPRPTVQADTVSASAPEPTPTSARPPDLPWREVTDNTFTVTWGESVASSCCPDGHDTPLTFLVGHLGDDDPSSATPGSITFTLENTSDWPITFGPITAIATNLDTREVWGAEVGDGGDIVSGERAEIVGAWPKVGQDGESYDVMGVVEVEAKR